MKIFGGAMAFIGFFITYAASGGDTPFAIASLGAVGLAFMAVGCTLAKSKNTF